MRRFICLIVLLPGLFQQAHAQQSPGTDDTISSYLTQRFGVARQKAAQISVAVTTAAEKYSLPPAVLLAIISIESRFRDTARGKHGATGLMQVVPSAHRNLVHNVKDLTKPDVNIDIGSSILHGYLRSTGGNLEAAMKRYGGSFAYAHMIETRAVEFAPLFNSPQASQDAAGGGMVSTVFAASDADAAEAAVAAAMAAAASTPQAASGAAAVSAVSQDADANRP